MIWQKNPLTVVGEIDRCWLFTYRTPQQDAYALLPKPLEPVTHAGYAFWNIVVCHVSAMRPRYFPSFVGIDYWHIAYRLHVRLPRQQGTSIEGLYFLRSDCNQHLMTLTGNLLTDFHFHTAPLHIQQDHTALDLRLLSNDAPFHARLRLGVEPQYDAHSAFASLDEAATFLKYKPYGISLDKAGRANVVHITRNEQAWHYRLTQVEYADWTFLHDHDIQPEICYTVEPIHYQWDRGQVYAMHEKIS
jgi:hypothetical protein